MNITNKFSMLKPLNEIVERKQKTLADSFISSKLASPRQVLMEEEFLPFFNVSKTDQRNWRNDQPAWKFELPDLKESVKRGINFPYVRNINFTLNPHTEKLLKVQSSWPAGIPPIKPMPSPLEEESQMLQVKERFTGLPDTALSIEFEAALKAVQESGPALPNSAKQIIAYLVIHSTIRYTDRPTWIIHTRGIIPFEPKMPVARHQTATSIPEDARNHVRHVVDAETGHWLFSDTTPQPV
jgi:hypothetical protein